MIDWTQRDEAEALWAALIGRLAAAPVAGDTAEAAEFRRACGYALANARAALSRGGNWPDLLSDCFDAALAAGAPPSFLSRIRLEAQDSAASGFMAQTVAALVIRLCLAAEVQALADAEFDSRDEADAALARLREGFEAAIDAAMALRQMEVVSAFSALYAAAAADLTARARLLPRWMNVSFGQSLPSVVAAYRLYGDAGRAGEIAAENRAPHPFFLPATIRALSDG